MFPSDLRTVHLSPLKSELNIFFITYSIRSCEEATCNESYEHEVAVYEFFVESDSILRNKD